MSLEPRELEALVARDERAWRQVMSRHGKLAVLAARRLRRSRNTTPNGRFIPTYQYENGRLILY